MPITPRSAGLNSIELFTGAGGLALGVARAGFEHASVIEWNRIACESLRTNANRIPLMRHWPVYEGDARQYDFRAHTGRIALIAAGAPCQPWSLGGKHRGYSDERNLFPEVFRAVREIRPPAVIIENVKGLLRSGFREYFDYILLCLTAPEVSATIGETWLAHKARLRRAVDGDRVRGLRYDVTFQLMNAADYGVPQRRDRVFIIALRSDMKAAWKQLLPTHSEDALLYAKWVDGSYWIEHGIRPQPTPQRVSKRVRRLEADGELFRAKRWRTVRDALAGLPEPKDSQEHPTIANHVGNPGARSYPGHTGSPLDEPAKALKAGDHGVPGGENMLRRDDGTVRYFTVREAARLQGFPDDYAFQGAWSEGFRQLGNAVPVQLAHVVALAMRRLLDGVKTRDVPSEVEKTVVVSVA